MLFELLQGEVVRDGWQDEHVKESLDLCLSCKACKSDCPTNVDIATYKAEFLSHYYERKPRPLQAYAFGLVDRWARAGFAGAGDREFAARCAGSEAHAGALRRNGACRGWPRQFPALGCGSERRACARRGRQHGRSDSVGGYVQQLFSSGDQPRGAGGAARSGLARDGAARASVLRAAAVRFRHARSRQGISAGT